MATFSTLQGSVSRRLLDPNNQSVSVEDVRDAVNGAVSYWKLRRFWFNETDAPVGNLVIGSSDVPNVNGYLLPAMEDASFYIEYSSQRYPLNKRDLNWYNGRYMDNGFGMPNSYIRSGSGYKVYPIPDRAYVLGGNYLRDYPDMVLDGDTNDFTVNATRLVRLWACADLSGELRQDDKMEAYFRAAALDEYNNLLTRTRKTNATGQLTLTSNLI